MAAAIPTVFRVNSLDPDDPRAAGPPGIPGCGPPAIPGCGPSPIPGCGPPAIPGASSGPPGTPVPPPLPAPAPPAPALIPAVAAAPAPTSLVAAAAPGASEPVPSGAGRGIDWVPPGAIRPRARANSRTTHRLAAPSRSLAWARVVATDWMAP